MCMPRPVPLDLWIRLPNICSDLPENPWAGCALLLCVATPGQVSIASAALALRGGL